MAEQFRKTVQAPEVVANKLGEGLDGEVMEALLDGCVKINASDLHLGNQEPPIYRRHGRLYELEGYRKLDIDDMVAAVSFFLGEDSGDNIYWARYHERGGA
ncbi:MAG: hypothetical protein KAW89_03305, partial [Armatimonadetes bacterium]|nr:hypothetical protein [Armatimonadota bacterium]